MEIESTVQVQNRVGQYQLIFLETRMQADGFSVAQERVLSWCGLFKGYVPLDVVPTPELKLQPGVLL